MQKISISAPEPLSSKHVLDDFDCGQHSLNEWLKKKALKSEGLSARTYVVCDGVKVIGYYCLAMGNVVRNDAPGKIRRNMPDPVPVMVLGRLAVDYRCKKIGIGRGLLKDAILRSDKINADVGFRALMVHALDEHAQKFYLNNGFKTSPHDELMLFLPLPAVRTVGVDIPVKAASFDAFLLECLALNVPCRLVFVFMDGNEMAGETAKTIFPEIPSEAKVSILQSTVYGQQVLDETCKFQALVNSADKAGHKWQRVAVSVLVSPDGSMPSEVDGNKLAFEMLQKLQSMHSLPQDYLVFNKKGKRVQFLERKQIEVPEFETDIN